MEPIESQSAPNSRHQPKPPPPKRRNQKHPRDIDNPQRHNRSHRLQRPDHQRRPSHNPNHRHPPPASSRSLGTYVQPQARGHSSSVIGRLQWSRPRSNRRPPGPQLGALWLRQRRIPHDKRFCPRLRLLPPKLDMRGYSAIVGVTGRNADFCLVGPTLGLKVARRVKRRPPASLSAATASTLEFLTRLPKQLNFLR
jgi:hypothetical protein